MTTSTENVSAAPASRFDKLTELLTGSPTTPRAQRLQHHLKASRPRNAMLAVVLHACARFERGLLLSDLEARMLHVVRRANSNEDLKRFGRIYQALSSEQRSTFFPRQLAELPIDHSYTEAQFTADLKALVPELLKQPNFRKVDVSQLDADGRVPPDDAFHQAVEHYGHGMVHFTAATAAPEARQAQDSWATVRAVSFKCVRESSEWSNSCEPFFALAGSSDLGPETTYRSQIFGDTDVGDVSPFYADAFAFNGPFDKAVMVEVEIWEKDQGDGWDTLRNAMIEMSCACFSGACEMVVTGGLAPVAAVFALAGIVTAILAGVFGACNDDFQINQELTWDRAALLAASGTLVKVLYDPGGKAGAFEITFAISVSGVPNVRPTLPYPFPEPVVLVLADSAAAWASGVLSVYQPAKQIIGTFDGALMGMTSVLDVGFQTVVVEWPDTAVDVVSTIGVAAPGSCPVDIQVQSSGGPGARYQGWTGEGWADAPAILVNGTYWYRANVSRATTLYAKTYRQGEADASPFTLYAYLGPRDIPVAPSPPFPFPEVVTLVQAATPEGWGQAMLGADAPPHPEMGGTFDAATASMTSVVSTGLQSIVMKWEQGTAASAISILALVGSSASLVTPAISGNDQRSKYQGWDGTAWVDGPAVECKGVHWYRCVVTALGTFFAKTYRQSTTGVAPFTIHAFVAAPS